MAYITGLFQEGRLPVTVDDLIYSVSDFVAVFNQTLEYAYPSVTIEGEVDNYRVSRDRWVYFSLKDDTSRINFFGSKSQMPGPLEDGMVLQVKGFPRLHNQYGFSINVQSAQPVGEGSINRAAKLLEAKLTKEGLFDPSRKRQLPYPPTKIGLITSLQSAAYQDFIKIINSRWVGLDIKASDVIVQGEMATEQVVEAINWFNLQPEPVDVLVITRGGGSPSELAVFNQEAIVRAVATSRIATLVAIGHEIDISLAEKAADQRASTPSNAAELLTPDKKQILLELKSSKQHLSSLLEAHSERLRRVIADARSLLTDRLNQMFETIKAELAQTKLVIGALNPSNVLKRGYVIARIGDKFVKRARDINLNDRLNIEFIDGKVTSRVEDINYG